MLSIWIAVFGISLSKNSILVNKTDIKNHLIACNKPPCPSVIIGNKFKGDLVYYLLALISWGIFLVRRGLSKKLNN